MNKKLLSLFGLKWNDTCFVGATMADARLDDALFVDCDLRGADLRAVKLGVRATMTGARFVRCDLRETNWNGRELAGVTFTDCRMHNLLGHVDVADVDIIRPDLSPHGDGSFIGTASSVLAAWKHG